MILVQDNNGHDVQEAWTPLAKGGGNPATATATDTILGPFSFTDPFVIRLVASTTCFFDVAVSASTDVTKDAMLVANLPEYILVPPGATIAVKAQTTAGTVNWAVRL
ncbi:MAG TPA: hypothetical protein VJ840_18730 [Gemmatimonadaceae bacterium]|nr:hypothetical protein [Gemmatimonadaceae bacterium]